MTTMLKISFAASIPSAVIALLLAAFSLYAAFDHNPQGEFYDTSSGDIDFANAGSLFAVNFGVVFVGLTVIFSLILALFSIGWSSDSA